MNRKQQMFGNKLKQLRLQKKLTQEQLGDSIGVTANAIGQFERGIMYPNFETLHRIITVLGVDANLFFSDKSKDYPYSARWFAELIKGMNDEDRIAASKFLSGLSRIMASGNEKEVIESTEDDDD